MVLVGLTALLLPVLSMPSASAAPNTNRYTIRVRTGCGSGAGTDNWVMAKLVGTHGSTNFFSLEKSFNNDFERCDTDSYLWSDLPQSDIGQITHVEITTIATVLGAADKWQFGWASVYEDREGGTNYGWTGWQCHWFGKNDIRTYKLNTGSPGGTSSCS
jgi:hypothetical protein